MRIWLRIMLFSSVTFKMPTKNILFFSKCLSLFRFECTFTSFFKDKSYKKVANQYRRNQGFSSVFCLLIEEYGSGAVQIITDPDADPEGPRIRNTAYFINKFSTFSSACCPWWGLGSGTPGFRIRGSWSVSRATGVFNVVFWVCRNQCGEAYATTTLTVKRRKDDYRSVLKHNVKREYIPQSRGILATSE